MEIHNKIARDLDVEDYHDLVKIIKTCADRNSQQQHDGISNFLRICPFRRIDVGTRDDEIDVVVLARRQVAMKHGGQRRALESGDSYATGSESGGNPTELLGGGEAEGAMHAQEIFEIAA